MQDLTSLVFGTASTLTSAAVNVTSTTFDTATTLTSKTLGTAVDVTKSITSKTGLGKKLLSAANVLKNIPDIVHSYSSDEDLTRKTFLERQEKNTIDWEKTEREAVFFLFFKAGIFHFSKFLLKT